MVAKIRSNISQQHSWKDVFDALRDAAEDYNNPKGIKVVHKWFRAAAGKAELVEPFVDFIPDELKVETKRIVAEVNGLIDDGDVQAPVKIFVTSATRSFEVKEYFEEDEMVDIPRSLSGAMAGSADSQFDWNFGHNVAQRKDSSSAKEP